MAGGRKGVPGFGKSKRAGGQISWVSCGGSPLNNPDFRFISSRESKGKPKQDAVFVLPAVRRRRFGRLGSVPEGVSQRGAAFRLPRFSGIKIIGTGAVVKLEKPTRLVDRGARGRGTPRSGWVTASQLLRSARPGEIEQRRSVPILEALTGRERKEAAFSLRRWPAGL